MVATPAMLPRNNPPKRAGVDSYEEFHPYGTTAWVSTAGVTVSLKRYKFTGMERDEETGLQCHGVRYYAPWLGRWTSADPIGLGDGVNRYCYCHGGVVRHSDPSGLAEALSPAQRASTHVVGFTGEALLRLAEEEGAPDILPPALAGRTSAEYVELGNPTLANFERAAAKADAKAGVDTSNYVSKLKNKSDSAELKALFAIDRTHGKPTAFDMSAFGSGKPGDPLGLWTYYENAKIIDEEGRTLASGCAAACKIGLGNNKQSVGGASDATPSADVVKEAGKKGTWLSIPLEANLAMLDKLDEGLNEGRVMMVGVSYAPGTKQNVTKGGDAVTDHFFLVFGRTVGDKGEVQYLFIDNATQSAGRKIGALNVNPYDGSIFASDSAVGPVVATQVR